MSTPIPQAVLDQVARDAAANAPKNLLNKFINKLTSFGGKTAPAPTSSAAQVLRDAKAGGQALKNYASATTSAGTGITAGGLLTGLSVAAPLILGGSEDSGIKWRRLGYPSKAAYDTAVRKNAHKNQPLETEKTDNTSEINKRLDQQKAERAAALAITKGDYDHSSGSYRQILPEEETREVPGSDGRIVQTGKDLGGGGTPIDMSRSFNDLLKGVKQQPFGGSQLPTTMGNPYTATYKQTQGFGDEIPDIGGYNGVKFDSEGGRNAINSTNLQDQAPLSFSAPFIEGGSERIAQQASGITSGRLSDALNSVREQEAGREMTPERRQQMASMAFLNTKGSMEGLKARDAVNDVVYAGGQHYGRGALTEDGKLGDKYKIDRADARDIASGQQSAAGLLDVYKSRIKEAAGSTTPVEAQEPPTIERPGIKQSFGRTETIGTPIDTNIPDTTAFNINNGVDVPAFGNKGGYKPMSKKSEVDYSSIFSY